MQWVMILLIAAAIIMVVVSLVRGLLYFAKASDALNNPGGAHAMHLKSNQMMFARVKWQAIAIVLLIGIGVLAGSA
jgi:hypothetical protein